MTARTFEDLGVSAYNGAGQLLTVAANLLTAGKIVSVEARHAAAIRDLLVPNSFAASDVVDCHRPRQGGYAHRRAHRRRPLHHDHHQRVGSADHLRSQHS